VTDGRAAGSRVRTVFLGSGAFGIASLRRLATHPQIDLVGVVTAPARPAGRDHRRTPTPVDATAQELGIRTMLRPERLRAPDAIASVLALGPELAVLADYGQLVPPALLGLPHGALNLHPSLLPRHRGATPIPATILAGDQETGVTLIRMDEGLDTGPIVAQWRMPLDGTESAPNLEDALETAAGALLDENVGPWVRGEITAHPQPVEGATMTRALRREDGRLDPGRPARELARQVRAYQPWPGSFIDTSLGRLIVHQAVVLPGQPGEAAGRLVASDRGLALTTTSGRLSLERAQLAGRRPTDAAALLRGAPGLVGRTVELR
jgi:methionyl-tRNA formyltransferase